jgi:diguanylate cyclase (GGDEF)-like protein
VIPVYLPQLLVELLAITFLCLLLFRTSLTFLAIFLGTIELIITVLLPPNNLMGQRYHLLIHSGTLLATGVYFSILLVFLSRGVDETRRLVFGLFFSTGAVFALLWVIGFEVAAVFYPPIIVTRLLILLAGSILVVFIHSKLYQSVPRAPAFALILMALLGATFIDAFLMWVTSPLTAMIPERAEAPPSTFAQLLVRGGFAVWFSIGLSLVSRFRNVQATELATGRPFSLLNFITYRQQYEIARNIAITDELTSLYNRRHFNEVFPREVERAKRYDQPLSLAFVDIDFFKRFNDTYGHSAGDTVLVDVARVLTENSRDIDIIFRYGGEEFVILLPSTSKTGAVVAMNKLRELVSQIDISRFGTQIQRVTISVGIATCPGETSTGDELVIRADKRLYSAKSRGRNQVVADEV